MEGLLTIETGLQTELRIEAQENLLDYMIDPLKLTGALMKTIQFYGRPSCPSIYLIRRELDKRGIQYEYIDIWQDPDAAARVREINNGYESVPTLVFADGSTLTEPSTRELLEKIQPTAPEGSVSVSPDFRAMLFDAPTLRLLAGLLVLAGIMADLQLLTWLGMFVLVLSLLLYFINKRR